MYICVTVNINETARPLVLMVTQVGCDELIDLGVWSFLFHTYLAARQVCRFQQTVLQFVTATCQTLLAAHPFWLHVHLKKGKNILPGEEKYHIHLIQRTNLIKK